MSCAYLLFKDKLLFPASLSLECLLMLQCATACEHLHSEETIAITVTILHTLTLSKFCILIFFSPRNQNYLFPNKVRINWEYVNM